MIKVLFTNCQSIKQGTYILDKGVNVIKGENSHGKSIFRKWLTAMLDRTMLYSADERYSLITYGQQQGNMVMVANNKVIQLTIGQERKEVTLGVYEQEGSSLNELMPLSSVTDNEGWSRALEKFGLIETVEDISPHIICLTGKKLFYTTTPAENDAYLEVTIGDVLAEAYIAAYPDFMGACKLKKIEVEKTKEATVRQMNLLRSYVMSEKEKEELALLETFAFDIKLFKIPKMLRPIVKLDLFEIPRKQHKWLAQIKVAQSCKFREYDIGKILERLNYVQAYGNGMCPECGQPLGGDMCES